MSIAIALVWAVSLRRRGAVARPTEPFTLLIASWTASMAAERTSSVISANSRGM